MAAVVTIAITTCLRNTKSQSWRSYLYKRSKADIFKMLQRDPLPPGSNALGDDTMTADVMAVAHSEPFKDCEFCLVSSNGSMAELARRLREEGRMVRGAGRRQATRAFLENCDAFSYIDPANRYELLMDEGLVSVHLYVCIYVHVCIMHMCTGMLYLLWSLPRFATLVRSLKDLRGSFRSFLCIASPLCYFNHLARTCDFPFRHTCVWRCIVRNYAFHDECVSFVLDLIFDVSREHTRVAIRKHLSLLFSRSLLRVLPTLSLEMCVGDCGGPLHRARGGEAGQL